MGYPRSAVDEEMPRATSWRAKGWTGEPDPVETIVEPALERLEA
jgi:hypothetical protein